MAEVSGVSRLTPAIQSRPAQGDDFGQQSHQTIPAAISSEVRSASSCLQIVCRLLKKQWLEKPPFYQDLQILVFRCVLPVPRTHLIWRLM